MASTARTLAGSRKSRRQKKKSEKKSKRTGKQKQQQQEQRQQTRLPGRQAVTRERPKFNIEPVPLPPNKADYKKHFEGRRDAIPDASLEEVQQLVHDAGQCPEAVDV